MKAKFRMNRSGKSGYFYWQDNDTGNKRHREQGRERPPYHGFDAAIFQALISFTSMSAPSLNRQTPASSGS